MALAVLALGGLTSCGGGSGSAQSTPPSNESPQSPGDEGAAGTSPDGSEGPGQGEPSASEVDPPDAPGEGSPGGGQPEESPSSRPTTGLPHPEGDPQPHPAPGEGGAHYRGDYLHPESFTPHEVTVVTPWTIVNRVNALPADYEPELVEVAGSALEKQPTMRLAPEAARAWEALRTAAAADGVELRLNAAYRSYDEQQKTWEEYEAKDPDHVFVYTAAPGRSEHQTGLAVDIADMPKFPNLVTDNARGRWLTQHAAEHGWILRYPKDRQAETGYRYEAWHWRYVGPQLARQLAEEDQTMEQWAGLVE